MEKDVYIELGMAVLFGRLWSSDSATSLEFPAWSMSLLDANDMRVTGSRLFEL